MRIAVLSDSHGALANISRALEIAQPIDMICFAGDGCRDIERWLSEDRDDDWGGGGEHGCGNSGDSNDSVVRSYGRSGRRLALEIVKGNCDLADNYPSEVVFRAGGMRILITHGHLYNVKSGYQRLVYRAEELQERKPLFWNTGHLRFTQLGAYVDQSGQPVSGEKLNGKPSFASY